MTGRGKKVLGWSYLTFRGQMSKYRHYAAELLHQNRTEDNGSGYSACAVLETSRTKTLIWPIFFFFLSLKHPVTHVWIKQLASLSADRNSSNGELVFKHVDRCSPASVASDCLVWIDQEALLPAPVVLAACVIRWFRPTSHHTYTSDCLLRLSMLNFEVSVFGIGWCHRGKRCKKK